MPAFVHLTSEDNTKNIEKNGLRIDKIHYDNVSKGIFCMPVIDDFFSTHQWLREIKRFNKKNIVGVYFRIPDNEPVWYGFYNEEHKHANAGLAIKDFIESPNRLGYQVIITRKITPKEIVRIKNLPQLIGWRYFPDAHGRKQCLCPACLGRGEYKASVVKEQRYYELISKLRQAKEEEVPNVFIDINTVLEFSDGKIKDYQVLLPYLESSSIKIIVGVLNALSNFKNDIVFKKLLEYLSYSDFDVKNASADALFKIKGRKALEFFMPYKDDCDLKEIVREYMEIYEE